MVRTSDQPGNPAPGDPQVAAPTPGQRSVDVQRVLAKVQAHPTGALLVENAVQACVIEDQDELVAGLRAELVAATSGRAAD